MFCIVDDAPKMGDLLVKVASNCHDKCLIVGLQLFLPFSQLYAIESRNHNPINCFAEIFDLWERQADLPYTWVTIIDVLRSPAVNENKLAFEVEHWLSLEGKHNVCIIIIMVAEKGHRFCHPLVHLPRDSLARQQLSARAVTLPAR